MKRDPLSIWQSEVPESTVLGLYVAAQEATRKAYTMCKEAFPGYSPLSYIVGQNRFVALQHRLLQFGATDGVLKARPLFHLNGMPFTQLYTPGLHITTATVDEEIAFPQMSLLRETEQSQQIDFLGGDGILICHLAIHVSSINLASPAIARILFPDGYGGYLEPFVDLMKTTSRHIVLPVERVKDTRHTPSIGETFRNALGKADA